MSKCCQDNMQSSKALKKDPRVWSRNTVEIYGSIRA